MTQDERFWSKVDKSGACWIWTGPRVTKGYGRFSVGRQFVTAHRYSFALVAAIPAGMFVLHRCDTPPCVNPEHLWLGSHADNMRDMSEKGRARRGVLANTARITETAAAAIFNSSESLAVLSHRHGISKGQVCNIRRGRYWRHVTGASAQ